MANPNSIEYCPGKQHKIPDNFPIIGGIVLLNELPSIVVHFHYFTGSRIDLKAQQEFNGEVFHRPKIVQKDSRHHFVPPQSSIDVRYVLRSR